MVKIQESSADDRLDRIMEDAAQQFDLRLQVTGWSRKTYELFQKGRDTRDSRLLVQVESFATTSGEIRVFHENGMPAAALVGERLEKDFSIAEAVIIRA